MVIAEAVLIASMILMAYVVTQKREHLLPADFVKSMYTSTAIETVRLRKLDTGTLIVPGKVISGSYTKLKS